MTTEDVAAELFDDGTTEERAHYVQLANSNHPDSSPREQLRSILSGAADETASRSAVAAVPAAPPLVAVIAARALVAAARRYGPSVLRALKSAVSKGYKAFEKWLDENKFARGIIVGVAASAVYDALKSTLF